MTYAQLMNSFRIDLGKGTLSETDKERLTQWLNEALTDAWATPEWIIWPWCVQVFTKTLADYKTARSGINDAEVWTVWSADPRDRFAAGQATSVVALSAVMDGDDLLVQAASATAEVIIFTRSPRQLFTVDDTDTEDIPSILIPWVKAEMRVKMLEWGLAPNAEQTLPKAYARRESEMNKLLSTADATLRESPWLSVQAWMQSTTR